MSKSPIKGASRRDAQHNRAHILEVARAAFARNGIDVSMDAIAKMAGLGAGTLYRNFPNKDALLAALLDRHYEGLEERRLAIEAEETDEARALERWIEALGDWMLAYEGLPEPLRAACRSESPLSQACHTVIATTERLLKAAQDKGHARTQVTGRDLFLGALAIAWAGGDTIAGEDTTKVLRTVLQSGWRESAAS
ncbi:TetR/AcrR family transcriptional regulator [Sphingobium tyrosinilyticum]|uniref:TetR/AcrR family transcriptional regulator n=1 Tax=Sphingobium tyrosinilyticum TaxID=2715436 RepID=A0ABV9F1K0_9SPHN